MFCLTKEQLDYLAKEVACRLSEGYGLETNEDLRKDVEDNITKLSFADRSTENGMGYVILRKEKSFAEQVVYPDTIYEIRYDFDLDQEHTLTLGGRTFYYDPNGLNIPYLSTEEPLHLLKGESIYIPDSCEYFVYDGIDFTLLMDKNHRKCFYTADENIDIYIGARVSRSITSLNYFHSCISLPENIVLKFVGGKLSNGGLIGDTASISADGVPIFSNIVLSNFDLPAIDARWYGLVQGEDISAQMSDLIRTYNQHIGTPVKIYGKYRIENRIKCRSGIVIWNDYMSPDVYGEKIYPGHEQQPLAEITIKAGVIAFDCVWLMNTTLGPSTYGPLGTTAFRGIKFVAEAQYDESSNPTVVLRHRITINPPSGFKVQDCAFIGFGNAILCDYTTGTWGSVMSNVLIENCRFRDCDYAMFVEKQNNDGMGELMINGLEMVRCTLDKSKLRLVGLYGVNRLSQIVINGTSNAEPLVDPVFIRMKYGTLELDQWYMEYLSGDFTVIGESGFVNTSACHYDRTTAIEIRNWYTMQGGFESDANHPNLKLKDVSVKSLPDLFPKGNIFFDCASIDKAALEQRIYDAVRLPSIVMTEAASGISYGCIVVKTEEYSVATVNDEYLEKSIQGDLGFPMKLFRGFFSATGGTIYRKDITDNLFIQNFGPSGSSAPTKEMSLTNLISPSAVFVDSTMAMLSFYKYRGAFRIRLKDSNGDTIANIRTPYNPGVCLILLSGPLSDIVSLSVTQASPVDTTSVELGVIGVRRVFPTDLSGNLDYSTSILQHCIVLNPDAPRKVGLLADRPKGYNDFSPADTSFRRSGIYTGFEYYPTDLGKPMYAVVTTTTIGGVVRDVVDWVDAAGENVVIE